MSEPEGDSVEGSLEEKTLRTLLEVLAREIVGIAEGALKKGRVKPNKRSYMRFRSGLPFQQRSEEIHKDDWALPSMTIKGDVERSSLYEEIVSELAKFCKVEPEIAELWLSQLTRKIAEAVLEERRDVEIWSEYIQTFLNEVTNQEPRHEFSVRVFIEGLSFESKEIELDDKTSLKNAGLEDFEIELDSWRSGLFSLRMPVR